MKFSKKKGFPKLKNQKVVVNPLRDCDSFLFCGSYFQDTMIPNQDLP